MTFKSSLVSWVTVDTLEISETFFLLPSFTTFDAKAEFRQNPKSER